MYARSTKWLIIIAMVAILAIALSGCSLLKRPAVDNVEDSHASEPVVNEVVLRNDPTPTPTHKPEETITPRPISLPIETPAPSTTALSIDPIDKPHRKFAYVDCSAQIAQKLGFTIKTPETIVTEGSPPVPWVEIDQPAGTVILMEQQDAALDGYPSQLKITVTTSQSNLNREDAINVLEDAVKALKADFPKIELSLRGENNRMLGEYGYYYNYRIDTPVGLSYPIRGRIFAVTVNHMTVILEQRNPARYNEDYLDVFAQVRASAKLPTAQ